MWYLFKAFIPNIIKIWIYRYDESKNKLIFTLNFSKLKTWGEF